MEILVNRFKAEYADCGSHMIRLDIDVDLEEISSLLGAVKSARITELESDLALWRGYQSRDAKALAELRTRVRNLEKLYAQRHAGVLNADAVMSVMGLPVEGGHDLCTRNSQTCLAVDCRRRLYREGDATCHPVEEES